MKSHRELPELTAGQRKGLGDGEKPRQLERPAREEPPESPGKRAWTEACDHSWYQHLCPHSRREHLVSLARVVRALRWRPTNLDPVG